MRLLFRIALRLVILAVIIAIVARIVPGITVAGGFGWYIWIALIFSVVNFDPGPDIPPARPAADHLDAGALPVGHQRRLAGHHGGAHQPPVGGQLRGGAARWPADRRLQLAGRADPAAPAAPEKVGGVAGGRRGPGGRAAGEARVASGPTELAASDARVASGPTGTRGSQAGRATSTRRGAQPLWRPC